MFDARHDLRHHFGLPPPCANPALVINIICEYMLPDIANIITQYMAPCGKNEQIIKEYQNRSNPIHHNIIECIARIPIPIARVRRCSRLPHYGLVQLICIQCCDESVYLFNTYHHHVSEQITAETFEYKFLQFVQKIPRMAGKWHPRPLTGEIVVTNDQTLDSRGDVWYTVQGWDD